MIRQWSGFIAMRVAVCVTGVTGAAVSALWLSGGAAWADGSEPRQAMTYAAEMARGRALVERGESLAAADAFELAMLAHPGSADARCSLAEALLRGGQARRGWEQLRNTLRFDPAHQPAGELFERTWRVIESRGLFNVGSTPQPLERVLGAPDRRTGHEGRERWFYGTRVLEFRHGKLYEVVDPRGAPDRLDASDQVTRHMDDRSWEAGRRVRDANRAVTEFFPPRQSPQNWTELTAVERLIGLSARGVSAEQMAGSMRARLASLDGAAQWRTLREGPGDLVYEWWSPGDDNRPAQHEIGRLINGAQDIVRLSYVAKLRHMPAGTRQRWVKQIGEAKLEPLHRAAQSGTQPGTQPAR